jgi:hypothetical protein
MVDKKYLLLENIWYEDCHFGAIMICDGKDQIKLIREREFDYKIEGNGLKWCCIM